MANIYTTKITSTDGGTTGDVVSQTLIGAEPSYWWYSNMVSDLLGNKYYCNGSKYITKIDTEDNITTIEVDTSAYGDTESVCAIALDRPTNNGIDINCRNLCALVVNKTSITNVIIRICKIPLSDFSWNSSTWYTMYTQTATDYLLYQSRIIVDKYNNVWLSYDKYSNGSGVRCLTSDGTGISQSPSTYCRCLMNTVDKRGIVWSCAYNYGIIQGHRWILNTAPYSISYDYEYTPFTVDDIIDTLCDKNGNIVLLRNKISDTTSACQIIRVDVDDYNNPTNIETKNLTFNGNNLTSCYNLHTNKNNEYFFSTTGIDGLNTYKITIDSETNLMNEPTLYIPGFGTNTVGNDPYGFYVSKWGHTGCL